jgi:hypothetical protein
MTKFVDKMTEPKQLVMVPNTDHFWFGLEHLAVDPAVEWILQQTHSTSSLGSDHDNIIDS